MELEICATSLTSVRNGCAARREQVAELCSLCHWGLPSWGLLQSSVALKTIPIHCLIVHEKETFVMLQTKWPPCVKTFVWPVK